MDCSWPKLIELSKRRSRLTDQNPHQHVLFQSSKGEQRISILLPKRRRVGMKNDRLRAAVSVGPAFAAFLLLCSTAAAQNDKVKGVINGRNGATMTVQTQDSGNVTVLQTDSTQVLEPEGVSQEAPGDDRSGARALG